MSGTNYFAEFNTNVKISLTNDDDFAVLAECNGNPNVVATESDRYIPGCIMIRTDYNLGDNLYQNNGTLSMPSWSVIGAGGGPVTGLTGSPTQVVYIDNLGNGTGDGLFTRDSMTNESLFGMNQNGGTQTSQFILNETTLFGIPGTNGGGIELIGIDGTAYLGVVNPTAVGAPFNYATIQRASDALGNTALQIVAPGQMFGSFTNGVDATAQISLTANQAGFGIDDSDYGGTDEAYIQVEWNSGLGAQEIVTNFRNGADVYRTLLGSYGVKFDFGGGNTYTFPKVDGANAEVLTTDGAGNLSWQAVGGGGSITADQIGFGDSSNTLTSTSAFKYYDANNLFEQTVPNNTGNAGTTTSPLAFGPASFVGSGIDDMTLTWDSASYKSNKYGGNLTIQIDSTGSPDTFSWSYSGGYSQIIGSGSGVPITGTSQLLSDTQGHTIAIITFGSTTGHTNGDRWNASTSLSTYAWGSLLTDGVHEFVVSRPVVGQFYGGDAQYLLDLGGNGTRWEVADQIGEFGIYAPRYFRIEAPGGNTAVLADMQNDIWRQYTSGFYIRNTGDTNTWFTTDGNGGTTQIGNVSGAGNATVFSVNDASRLIDGYVEDGMGGNYGLQLNGATQVAGLFSDDGAGYTGLVRATATTSYIQSQAAGYTNVFQTTATSALATSTDGTDSVTLQINPTNASITGLTNSNQFLFDDFNQQVIANVGDSFQVRNLLGATALSVNPVAKFATIGDYTNTKAYLNIDWNSNVITIDSKNGSTVIGDAQNTTNLTKATLSDSGQTFTFATGGSDRFIAFKDWIFLGGAVVHGSIQTDTTSGNVTMNNNVSTLVIDPASVVANKQITLPATSGGSGSIVTIVFGGTITSGNPVVTTLSWAAGSGNTLVASNLPTTANAGDSVSFEKVGAYWYQIK